MERWQQATAALDRAAQEREPTTQPCDPSALEHLAGRYGPRTIRVRDCGLTLQRDGSIELELAEVSDGLYEMVLPEGARAAAPLPQVRFVLEAGSVTGLEFVHADGRLESVPRDAQN